MSQSNPIRSVRSQMLVFAISVATLAAVAITGCKSTSPTTRPTSRPLTASQRQDAAMRDPFGYSPNMDRSDVSGGGFGEFDNEGFQKDLKNVLDP